MLDTVRGLLNDARLDGLMRTPEFREARFRLRNMEKLLLLGEELTKEQKDYLASAQFHIKNIYPHLEILMVNGEYVPVEFTTGRRD